MKYHCTPVASAKNALFESYFTDKSKMTIQVKGAFGLEFIGGRSELVAQRKQNFAPAGFTITISEREGPSKLCSGATTSATKEFTA